MEQSIATHDVKMTTWSLEMRDPAALRPSAKPDGDIRLARSEVPSPEFARFLYTAIGGDWYWMLRLPWTHQQWLDWIDRPGFETWVLYVRGTPAGYFILEPEADGSVQIPNFGLLPSFIGQGLGGYLLTEAAQRGWSLRERWPELPEVTRVWLHTCSVDGAAALKNYQARGFTIFDTHVETETLPVEPPGPWPGAQRPRS